MGKTVRRKSKRDKKKLKRERRTRNQKRGYESTNVG